MSLGNVLRSKRKMEAYMSVQICTASRVQVSSCVNQTEQRYLGRHLSVFLTVSRSNTEVPQGSPNMSVVASSVDGITCQEHSDKFVSGPRPSFAILAVVSATLGSALGAQLDAGSEAILSKY